MPIIQYDFLTPARHKLAGATATYEMFKKVWGRSVIDGIEVYNGAMFYYQNGAGVRNDLSFNRFINKIGIKRAALTDNDYTGIENAYFKLNASKYEYAPMDHIQIADDLSNAFAIGDEFEVAVSYGGDLKRFAAGYEVSGTMDTLAIRTMLNSDKIKYFANASLTPAGDSFGDSIQDFIANNNRTPATTPLTKLQYNEETNGKLYDVLAMLDDGTTFQQQGAVYNEEVRAIKTTDQYGNIAVVGEYSYIVKFKVISTPLVGSFITEQCSLVAHALSVSMAYRGSQWFSLVNHAPDTLIKEAVLLMNNPSSNGAFYRGYLRVDYCAAIKRQEFVKILAKCFDTGYTKKKVKWWKKALAIVVIIIAIVIIVLTWWTGVGNVAGGSMMALGLGLMYASVFLTLSMMLYASAFPEASDQIRMIGKAAVIVGYAAMVVGVWNLIQQSFNAAALDAANKAAIEAAQNGASSEAIMAAWNSTSSSFTVEMFVEGMIEGVKDSISSVFTSAGDLSVESVQASFSNMTMGQVSGWMDNISTGMYYYNQFFSANPPAPYVASDAQSDKEVGVTGYYAAISMMDNTDALERMTLLKDNIVGGNMTKNLLAGM